MMEIQKGQHTTMKSSAFKSAQQEESVMAAAGLSYSEVYSSDGRCIECDAQRDCISYIDGRGTVVDVHAYGCDH